MRKVLPFAPRTPKLNPPKPPTHHYELQDDGLSVNGAHPRRGDICCVRPNEEIEGEPHMAITPSGRLICGLLQREGSKVALTFPNKDFPPYTQEHGYINVLGRVERFFCAVDGNFILGFELTKSLSRRAYIDAEIPQNDSRFKESALRLITTAHMPAYIVNWRADSAGKLIFVSESWREVFEPHGPDSTWSYVKKVHPRSRRAVALAWLNSMKTRAPLDVTCEAFLQGTYRPVRNMAVPIRNVQTGEYEWVGTLHLLHAECAQSPDLYVQEIRS